MSDDSAEESTGGPLVQAYLPRIGTLYLKHVGVTKALSETFEEATAVCLCAASASPTQFELTVRDSTTQRLLHWPTPDERQRRAWANAVDRVEAGAYGVALSAIEASLGLVAVERASTLSGADYYVATSAGDYLEDAVRLEVSGTASTEVSRLHERVKMKLRQVSHPADPSLACVVSFGARMIVVASA